jgi:flagellar basal-body rod protein FlgF
MSNGIWAALSGANVQLEALDVAANNVANASTPAFRGDHAVFREYLGKASARAAKVKQPPNSLHYSTVDGVAANSTAGGMVATGRPLDVAIHGEGMFALGTPRGQRFTRLGSLQLAQDGRLVTRDGDVYLGRDHRPIRVPAGVTDVRVGTDGTVHAGGDEVGQLLLVNFKNPGGLQREGALVFKATPGSGPPVLSSATLERETLEQSNVSVVKGMVDIVGASRGFEACQRAIDAFRDADRKAAMSLMAKE